MTEGVKTIIYPVKDLAGAKALFGRWLGARPTVDEVYYAQFELDGQIVGLDPHGHRRGMTGPVAYRHVTDIAADLRALLDAGAVPLQDVTDVGGGRLIASVKDPDGNLLGLMQQS